MPLSTDELQQTLRQLPKIGTLVKAHAYREVWRFEFGGKPYYLKFYPRDMGVGKRLLRGSPALREFSNLQLLQKAKVPAPRAVAHLSGFMIADRKGDAVILEGIEPSVQLDEYLNERLLAGEGFENHRALVREVISVIQQLGKAGLGHSDLHLGNLLLHDGKLYLLDAYALRTNGMSMKDVLLLGHSVARFATKTDLLRAWRVFTDAGLPRRNRLRRRLWRKFVNTSRGENRYFGRLRAGGGWSGHFYRHCKFPRRWAPTSRLSNIHMEEWKREWGRLLARIDADQLEILKRSRSGDVLAGEVAINGKPVDVVIKRNRRRVWYRYLNEIGRGGRAIRGWKKAWSLVARDIPTAWPLLMMERRILGYLIDSVIVFERVRGTQLSDLDLDALQASDRQNLFRRLGRTLRLLEEQGLRQHDSKSTNWIIVTDAKLGPVPVVVDVDGIRRITAPNWPINRLLRSMREHPQYTPADSKELCLGYAPYARLATSHEAESWGEGADVPPEGTRTSQPGVSSFASTLSPQGERGQER